MNWLCKNCSLYRQTFFLIFANFIFYIVLSMFMATTFILYPILKRSVDDVANIITTISKEWQHVAEEERKAYIQDTYDTHTIIVQPGGNVIDGSDSILPYIIMLEGKLSHTLNTEVEFIVPANNDTWYQAIIPSGAEEITLTVPRSRIGTRPPLVFFTILIATILFSILLSVNLARKLTTPITKLADSSRKLSRGQLPNLIPEEGPSEIKQLTKSFNKMAQDVNRLLENRTTLLIGVSHNLRTPISRMRLALELLPENIPEDMLEKLHLSLEEMNDIISQFLHLAQGLDHEDATETDLLKLIQEVINEHEIHNPQIDFQCPAECSLKLQPLAFKQILTNFLENAIRYSNNKPVTIELTKDYHSITVNITDEGIGIDEASQDKIFQPFISLNQSNSSIPGGTGLGLSINRLIAERYDWHIKLTNNRGAGATASITIPFR